MIRCGLLADGISTSAIHDQAILVRDGRIAAVLPQSATSSIEGANTTIIDLSDACLIPGLIDVHTHTTLPGDGRSYAEYFSHSDELMSIIGVMNVARHLQAGITTLREHGARNRVGFAVREGIQQSYVQGSEMLVSGRPITCTNGHFHFCNEVADGEDAIRDSVRRLFDEGADYIKIMASGGGTAGTDPKVPSYSVPELRAAASEAHRFGRLIAAHCHSTESIRRAIEADVDMIEHVQFLTPTGQIRVEPDIVESILESKIYLSPTIQAFTRYPRYIKLIRMQDAGNISPSQQDELSSLEANKKIRLGVIQQLVNGGLGERLVAGSDAGPNDIAFGHIDYDIRLLKEGGLSDAQALQTATRVAAEAVGLGDEIGTIVVGKVANLVAVKGDPTKDISAISRVVAVFQAGTRVH